MAAYLRLLALPPLRLRTGLRSADGACVPRCLLPPSPRHPGSKNTQWRSASNSFSSSHACTSDAVRSPASSSPWAPRNLQLFGSPPAATPPLLLRPPGPGASLPFPVLCSRPLPETQLGEGSRASALASPRGGAAAGRSARRRDGGNQSKTKQPSSSSLLTPPTMFRVLLETHDTNYRLHTPAPCCSSSGVSSSAPSGTDRCRVLQRGRGAAHAGRTGCQTPPH